jgi:hypothetical protein
LSAYLRSMKLTKEGFERVAGQVATRRSVFVVAVVALLLASLFLILSTWFRNWHLDLPASADKVTRINTVLAVSAYTLALIGTVAAVVAYLQASGRPSLKAEIKFQELAIEGLTFKARAIPPYSMPSWLAEGSVPFSRAEPFEPLIIVRSTDSPVRGINELLGEVMLLNTSNYAARNPGLRIDFDGLLFQNLIGDWLPALYWQTGKNGYKAIQWDGGTEYIVHGKWTRTLPQLDFNEVVIYRMDPPPKLVVTVVADGCKPVYREIPLKIEVQH